MQTVNQLLDQLKEMHKLPSDYKLALYLGVAQGSVQNWRHSRSLPDQKAVTRIAQELSLDADVLLLEVESQRAGNDFAKAAWMRIASRLQAGTVHVFVLVTMALVALLGSAPNAEAAVTSYDASTSRPVCVMLINMAAGPDAERSTERRCSRGWNLSTKFEDWLLQG